MACIRSVLALAIALASSPALADEQRWAERWIIEPLPEAPSAQELAAADVADAQELARAKRYADAARAFERIARKWPSSLHDCNLALAYLRSSALTRARLFFDLAAARGGVRPAWCTGEIARQIDDALRAAGFVQTTLEIAPAAAVLEVGGVAVRGVAAVWLPPGPATVAAGAAGYTTRVMTVSIAGPAARISLTLEPERDGAATPTTTSPATPTTTTTTSRADPTAAVSPPPRQDTPADTASATTKRANEAPDAPAAPRRPLRTLALATGLVGLVGTGVAGVLVWRARRDANALYPSEMAFPDAVDDYERAKLLAYTMSALVVGGFVGYALIRYLDEPAPTSSIQLTASPDSIGIVYGVQFGGGR